MDISLDDVAAIAELAKLELTAEEMEMYASQLSDILNYFERLQALDTSHIEATASVLPLQSVMRGDAPGQPLAPEDVIANAPAARDNQFRVNAVLDE